MYEMDFPVEEEELHVSMDGYSNMGSQKTRSFSISNKTMKYPPHHQDSKKHISPARARDLTNKIFTILSALNSPERIANELYGLFNIDSYHLMKEFGYGDGNLRGFFAHLGFEFDQNGNFILPFESPALDIPNKETVHYTDTELSSPPLPRSESATIWSKPQPPPRILFEGFSNNNENHVVNNPPAAGKKLKRRQTFNC